jgi:hypothetical protein
MLVITIIYAVEPYIVLQISRLVAVRSFERFCRNVIKTVQARISEMFSPEANAGIRVFSGGKDLIDIADMAQEERDAILYCFDQNVKKIENISPKLAAGLRPQREAMVKFAQIAKGTFPETKTYSYPGQQGGLAVDFLSPATFRYGDATAVGMTEYLGIDGTIGTTQNGTWDIAMAAGTTKFILGKTAVTYYKGCGTTDKHSYVVLFQDGIIELGTTPKVDQMQFKSELMDKYTPIAMQPLMTQSIEEGRSIYQYSTPGMIPVSHQTGVNISIHPIYTGTANIPLLGMVFYETSFNPAVMAATHAV